ncbi:MAG: MFS transporter, partial [Candidatus Omnitrophica bacterium]|nr:MFS transporter [Candidatus Omnitrophota bacterium]
MARFRDILRERNFSLLWSGQIISQFGDRLNQMALIGMVYEQVGYSTLGLDKVMLPMIIPVLIIGPVAGGYVDRWNRKWTMIISDITRGLFVLLIPLSLIYVKTMAPVYVIIFIVFSITRFFLPAKMAILPDIVSTDKLLIANSLSSTTRMIAAILSLPIAGFIVRWVGAKGGFYIDAISFFLSAFMIWMIRLEKNSTHKYKDDLIITKEALGQSISRSVFKDVMEGLRYLISSRELLLVTAMSFLLMSGVGAVSVVIVVFIQESLKSVTRDLGLLGMSLGAGLFLGSVLYGRFGDMLPKFKVIFSGFTMGGILVVLFSLLIRASGSLALALVLAAVLGLVSSPIVVSSNTMLHEIMPNKIRGRIFSSLEMIIHIAFLVFMLLTSFLAEFISKASILVFSGIFFAVCGVGGMVITKKMLTKP